MVFYTSDPWKIAVHNVKHAHDSGLQRLGWLNKLVGVVFIA